MDRKSAHTNGIRVELTPGTDEAVAVDELVDDFLHGDTRGMLHALHEPHPEDEVVVEAPPGADA
ncbi:hypothetical protein MUN78_11230 [Leucobacter allii]|uniref:Uncharacterized protein n=1 Tax=Leucobacter allii TaxID=2932247 RepID=A0ABY4FHV7_9MICO|nr:hypothetical protein [Leucobacter allii]UOQ56260.1 hypothetical protein MUN78_11230 [Leucobacter allii]UOR00728.1 hypothetical protein MUN77_11250 [Leucobacter allii]